MAAGRLAARDKWLLALLAVGTFGGQDIWRPGHLAVAEWRLGHLAARADPQKMDQMAVGTNGGWDIWRL